MGAIPVIDFSPAFGSDDLARRQLIDEVRQACTTQGFFALANHGVPQTLLDDVLAQSQDIFSLPDEIKGKYDKTLSKYNRGYERLRAQNFEKRTSGDLKEGFYFGPNLPESHPDVVAQKFNLGPNTYPHEAKDPIHFRNVIDDYISRMLALARSIVGVLCQTLDVADDWVPTFFDDPIAVLRLLHYPPQPADASEDERGIGAHTDFGAITILLQDMIGGLQVLDHATREWVDVEPARGILVVNLGNLMMRWTNDTYVSNLHRVINKSGKERYSVPFFLSGKPDFLVECFKSCYGQAGRPKYPAVTVGEWVAGRYADTYGTSKEKAVGEMSTELQN